VGSLPEVAGEAALYFDPTSPEGIADAIERAANDEGLRARLIRAGRERVAAFSYRRTAEETLAVFEKVGRGELRPPGLDPPRPLIPHGWLRAGHSRWYFRASALEEVRVTVVQPTGLAELGGQSVDVTLDEGSVVRTLVEPQQPREIVVVAGERGDSGFHRLDVTAGRTAVVQGQTLSVQVTKIVVVDATGARLGLLP
jgi:hypothetical protein